jgi:uncharacterized membrane protein
MIENDIVVLGLVAATLGVIFWTASHPAPFWQRFYSYVPALLLCYFVPALYNTIGLVDGQGTSLYNPVSRDVLLPAALVLLTLSIDLKAMLKLGPKLLFVFFAGTLGIMLGAPIAFLAMKAINPATVAGDTWGGMAALAGSWIGGGANMVAMREIFGVNADTFGRFAVVDVAIANLWMATLLFLAARAERIDARNGADTSAIKEIQAKVAEFHARHGRIASLTDLFLIVGAGLGVVALAHALATPVAGWLGANTTWASRISLDSPFVWMVLSATTIGIALSFTPARQLEGAGASRVGSLFLYFLIASIGLQMDLKSLFDAEGAWLLLLGAIWMSVHIAVLWSAAKLVRAPLFYFAVGSQGNIGAAASAPVVAAAFHPSLAPVGVLIGSVGYATGTYLAYLVGLLLKTMAGN